MGIIQDLKKEREQEELELEIEEEVTEFDAPSGLKVAESAARISITGASTFFDMVDRGSVMPGNEGEVTYFQSKEFTDTINANNVPAEDMSELLDARNLEYLQAKIANQQRWHEANDVIEEAGGSGMATEVGMSLLDPVSWLVGGGVMKAFKLGATAYKVHGRAALALNVTAGITTATLAVGASEKIIQTEAGIDDQERLNTMVMYGAAFGLGLPLIVPAIKATSKGASRVMAATGIKNLSENLIQPNGFSRFFAVSTANQMNNSKLSISREIGDKAVTRVRAKQTVDGEFITQKDDTAMDVKQELLDNSVNLVEMNVANRAKLNKIDGSSQALTDGTNWAKADNDIQQNVRSTIANKADDELIEIYRSKEGNELVDIDLQKLPDDFIDTIENIVRKEGFDSGIYKMPKDLDYIQELFTNFEKRATKAGLGGIAGKDSRGFSHIKYNEQYILSIGNVKAEENFANMLRNDAWTKKQIVAGKVTEEEITKEARRLVQRAMDRDIKRKYLAKGGDGSTSATRKRHLKIDRSLHPEMFVNDISVIASEYADNVGGKIAMKEVYGIEAGKSGSIISELDDVYRKIEKEGADLGLSQGEITKDIDNAKAIFETILGTRKYVKDANGFDPLWRNMKKGANALYSAGFVLYGLVEFTVAIARFGVPNVMKNFVPAFKRVQEQVSSANPTDKIVRLARMNGVAGQTLRGIKYDRYDNMEIAPTTGKIEMFLDKMSHASRKWSGFNYINDVSDMISGGAAMDELFEIIKGGVGSMSKQQRSQMARFGLSPEDITAIGKEKAIKYDADGVPNDFNLEEWADPQLAKDTFRYMQRATTDTIMRADGTRTHRWQSDNTSPFRSMMLQYTQMPTVLYERLLLNGMDEMSARTAVGLMTSISMMYMMMDLQDRAAVAAGVKAERDTQTMIFTKAVTRTPFAGIVPNFVDAGLTLSGNSTLGSNFAPRSSFTSFGGAGAGVMEKVFRLTTGLKDGVDDKDVVNALKIVPMINSLPILKQAMQFWVGGGTNEPYTVDKPAMEYIFEESNNEEN